MNVYKTTNSRISAKRIQGIRLTDKRRRGSEEIGPGVACRWSILTLLSPFLFIALASAQSDPYGKVFGSTEIAFNNSVKSYLKADRGEEQAYNELDIKRLNQLLLQTRDDVLSHVPEGDTPLRAAVIDGIPVKLSVSEDTDSNRDIKRQLSAVTEFLAKLVQVPKIYVDITVSSIPEIATAVLIYPNGETEKITTQDTFKNIYRGVYKLDVQRKQFKDIKSFPINLIQDPRTVLHCTLVSLSDDGNDSYCRFN